MYQVNCKQHTSRGGCWRMISWTNLRKSFEKKSDLSFQTKQKKGKIGLTVEQHRNEKDEIINVFKAPSYKFDREIWHYIRLEPEHAWVQVSEVL